MTTKKDKAEKEAEEKAEPEPQEEAEETSGPSGPVLSPVHDPEAPMPETVEVSMPEEGAVGGNVVDDGVEDIELGPPAVGQWVLIQGGDYAGHFAAYLGNVELKNDGTPKVVQVRTRDADNALLDVPYDKVSATTYSGGR